MRFSRLSLLFVFLVTVSGCNQTDTTANGSTNRSAAQRYKLSGNRSADPLGGGYPESGGLPPGDVSGNPTVGGNPYIHTGNGANH